MAEALRCRGRRAGSLLYLAGVPVNVARFVVGAKKVLDTQQPCT
jgi:hypothetical protein